MNENLRENAIQNDRERDHRIADLRCEVRQLERHNGHILAPSPPLTPEWLAYYRKIGLLPESEDK